MADSREALRKLQSGQTLTNAERQVLGLAPAVATPAATPTPASVASFRKAEEADAAAGTPFGQAGSTTVTPTTVTSTRSGITAQAGTRLGDTLTAQNAARAARDAAFANKPTDDPGPGNRWVWQERNQTWAKVYFGDGGGFGSTGSTGATGGTGGGTFTWTDPDTGQTKTFNSAAELNAFVTTWSTKKSSDSATAAAAAAAKAKADIEAQAKRTAQQDFKAALSELGLADLADTVDEMIRQDFTASQIKLELPKQPSYKLRFPGMQALRDAGQAINEATYISMEKGYIQTLGAYGLDANIFGTRSELGKYIANMVSPREFEERVNIAKTRVADNTDVVKQLKGYYPEIDDSAVVSYLLNPAKGMDIIKKQVRAAEIGAAATYAGFSDLGGKGAMGMGYAESLIAATGTADLAALKKDFGQAKTLSRTQSRLAGIEGQTYNDTEAVNAAIAQEQSSILASQRRAERETKFRFGGTSGVGSTSLRSTTNQ
jgi:hypothetical protein